MLQINSNIKDDSQVVLLLSCFVGHPVYVHIMLSIADQTAKPNWLKFI